MPRLPVTFLVPVVKTLPPACPPDRFLAPFGLVPEDLYDIDGKLDVELYDAIVVRSAQVAADSAIGLTQGALVDLRQLGLLTWILQNAPTVGEALVHYRRYNHLVCSGIGCEVEIRGPGVQIRFVGILPGRVVPRPVNDAFLVSFLRILGQLCDEAVPVRKAEVAQPDDGTSSAYRRWLGVVPQYGCPVPALTFDASLLDKRIVYADPLLLEQFRARADQLSFTEGRTTLRLKRHLLARLNGHTPRIADAARELGLGIRTLQDHLKEEGTTYQQVFEGIRRDWALAELLRPEHSVGEVAWLLGYSEQSAFQAAFKRWTGITPLQYRREGERRKTVPRTASECAP